MMMITNDTILMLNTDRLKKILYTSSHHSLHIVYHSLEGSSYNQLYLLWFCLKLVSLKLYVISCYMSMAVIVCKYAVNANG